MLLYYIHSGKIQTVHRNTSALLRFLHTVCTVTSKKYYVRGNFTRNSTNAIYLVDCIYRKCQYVGLPLLLNNVPIFIKSEIKTKKDPCGTARPFSSIWCHPNNPHGYLKVQFIEQLF